MTRDRALTALYLGACFFSLFMVWWVMIVPATWLVGNSERHTRQLRQALEIADQMGRLFTPYSLVFKYDGHRLVQFTHTLPAGIWAMLVPLQLHPGVRKRFRKAHRISGYVFFSASMLMMFGFAVIDSRGLDYIHNDFPTIPHDQHMSKLGLHRIPLVPVFRGVAALFLACAGLALRSAVRRDFASHRKWVLRHIGLGLWVAPQRLYAFLLNGRTPEDQKENFSDATYVGLLITTLGAELAVALYNDKLWASAAKSRNAHVKGE